MKKLEIISVLLLNTLIFISFGLILSCINSYDWSINYTEYTTPSVYNISLFEYFKHFGIFFGLYSLLEIGTLLYEGKNSGIMKPNNIYYIMSFTGLIYNLNMYVIGCSFAGLRYSVQIDDNTKSILYDTQYISDIKENLLYILIVWIIFLIGYILSKRVPLEIFSNKKVLLGCITGFIVLSLIWLLHKFLDKSVSNPNTLYVFQYSSILKLVLPIFFSWILYYHEVKINEKRKKYKPISNIEYFVITLICFIPVGYLSLILKENGNAICIAILLLVMFIYNTINIKFSLLSMDTLKYIVFPSVISIIVIVSIAWIGTNLLIGKTIKSILILAILFVLLIVAYQLCKILEEHSQNKNKTKKIKFNGILKYINNSALGLITTISIVVSSIYIFNVMLPNTYKEALNLSDVEISTNIVEKRRNEVSAIRNTPNVDDNIIQNKLNSLEYNYKPYDITTISGGFIYNIGRLIYPQQNEQHIGIMAGIRDTLITNKKIQDQQAIVETFKVTENNNIYTQTPTTAKSDYMLYTLSINNGSILTLICIVLGYTLQFAPLIILYTNRSIKLVGLNTLNDKPKLRVIYMLWNISIMYVISFIVQAFVNILGVYGIIFYTGISLPFISEGTCDMIFFVLEFLFISHCVLNVDKIKNINDEE